MSAAYLLIALAYVNGNFVQSETSDETYPSQAACVDEAKKSATLSAPHIPSDMQIVYKCVDISQVPNAVSIFGTATSL